MGRPFQAAFLILLVLPVGKTEAAQLASYRIEEVSSQDGLSLQRLIASVDGLDYLVSSKEGAGSLVSDFIDIVDVGDFDLDGHLDALVSSSDRGNGTLPQYYVVSHLGGTSFHVSSDDDLYTTGDVAFIKEPSGAYVLTAHIIGDGVGNRGRHDETAFFRLRYGKLEKLSKVSNEASLLNDFEFSVEDVYQAQPGPYKALFDLDGDGKLDTFTCKYWERWGAMLCDVALSLSGLALSLPGADQIGVLPSSSNGIRDLSINWTVPYKFDGTQFLSGYP